VELELYAGDLDEIMEYAALDGEGATAEQTLALVAEVRRLRAEVEAAEATVEEAADDLHHFMQERDRLQAVLVDIAAAVPAAHRNDGRDVPERIREGAAAEAEVRRLRADVAEARKSAENAIAELRMERTHHASTLRALWDCQEEADRG